jgi:cytochrome c2
MKKERSMGRTFLTVLSILTVVILLAGCSEKAKQGEAEQPAAEERVAETKQAVEPEVAETPNEVSFAAEVAPIFAAKCNACHHPDNAVKVDLTRPFHPELGLINRPNSWTRSSRPVLVIPGDPDASALIWKVEQTELELKVDGDPMPWHIDPLTDRELEDLRQWILQGANDDTLYRNTITRIFGDGVSLGSRGGKCAYCHHPNAAYGPDLTDLFDPERGSVNVASMFGDARIVPGDPEASVLFAKVKGEPLPPNLGRPMPLHYERLTSEEKQILRDWISEGAQKN